MKSHAKLPARIFTDSQLVVVSEHFRQHLAQMIGSHIYLWRVQNYLFGMAKSPIYHQNGCKNQQKLPERFIIFDL